MFVAKRVPHRIAAEHAAAIEDDGSRLLDGAAAVASGFEMYHALVRRDPAGAQLGSGQVHQYLAAAVRFHFRLPHEFDHFQPGFRCVVGAVDARTVHAAPDQLAHECIVGGSLAGEGHHDAHLAMCRRRAEQPVGLTAQQLSGFVECLCAVQNPFGLDVLAGQRFQRVDDGIEIGQYVAFGAAQRRQAECGELRLDVAQIVATQPDIGAHVVGGGAETVPVNVRPPGLEAFTLGLFRFGANAAQFAQQGGQLPFIEGATGAIRGIHWCFLGRIHASLRFKHGLRKLQIYYPGELCCPVHTATGALMAGCGS